MPDPLTRTRSQRVDGRYAPGAAGEAPGALVRAAHSLAALVRARVLHVPGADTDAIAGDRSYLVLAKPDVIMNDIRLRGLALPEVTLLVGGATTPRLVESWPARLVGETTAGNGGVAYAVQTAVNGGSKPLIFVRSRRVTVACRCHVSFVDRLQDGAAGQRRQADGARRKITRSTRVTIHSHWGRIPGLRPKLICTGPRNWCRGERKATAVTGQTSDAVACSSGGAWPLVVLSDLSVSETRPHGESVRRPT
jgi:hypothetical protein